MISYLEGITKLSENQLIVMTSAGVGYGVLVSDNLKRQLVDGQPIKLHIYTHVKEDQLKLFGFVTQAEKGLFQLLLGVSGVGPSTALGIADLGVEKITQAVQEAQVNLFTSVPRVGKKLAQKIIIELKPKLGSLKELELGEVKGQAKELAEALLALGFDESTSFSLARKYQDDDRPIELILKETLKTIRINQQR